jgi:hypothetical protein
MISTVGLFLLVLATTFFDAAHSQAADMKLEAQLVWGTTNSISPNPRHRAVDPDVEKRLKKLPFKWEHYFEVSRKRFSVPDGEEREIEMSKDCSIKVKNAGESKVQLNLYGKGKSVGKIGQVLPKGELLVTGGNAENLTAWFVVLKQVE